MTINPFRRTGPPAASTAQADTALPGSAVDPAAEPAGQPADAGPTTDPGTLAEAVFELRAARRRVRDLEGELDRARRDAGRSAVERAGAAVEGVAEQVATPLAHLATQVALVRAGGSVLTAGDLARIVEVDTDERHQRSHFWMNSDAPTFLVADPPGRRGEERFRVEFHVDEGKRLLVTAQDITAGRWVHRRSPVVRLI